MPPTPRLCCVPSLTPVSARIYPTRQHADRVLDQQIPVTGTCPHLILTREIRHTSAYLDRKGRRESHRGLLSVRTWQVERNEIKESDLEGRLVVIRQLDPLVLELLEMIGDSAPPVARKLLQVFNPSTLNPKRTRPCVHWRRRGTQWPCRCQHTYPSHACQRFLRC